MPQNATLSPVLPSSPAHGAALAILYAGGTFGCVGTPLAPMPAQDFLPILDQLISEKFAIRCISLPATHIRDSSQLRASDWIALLQQIIQLYQQGVRRILLIHGTDTLAYTAAFLAEVLAGMPLHLIVTGSQHPLLAVNGQDVNTHTDALDNLQCAIRQLQQPRQGCEVVFAGQCWPAQSVQKVHTTALQAFSGAETGVLLNPAVPQPIEAAAVMRAVQYLKQLNICTYYALPLDWPQQALQLGQLLDTAGLDALILLGFGAGNLPHTREIEQLLQQAASRGILLIIGSQVPFGGVDSRYAAGHWLGSLEVLSAGQLPVAGIYARLAWICCQSSDYAERKQYWLQAIQTQVP